MTTEESSKKPKIDINKLVTKARSFYQKKDQGHASKLSTGKNIVRPTLDEDFVVWSGGSHWKALTGLRGIPFGRLIQISGKSDSGKSTHAMGFMKFAQDQGVLVILWDSERKFSASRFDNKMNGCSDDLLVVDTNNIIDGSKAVANFIHAAKEMDPNIKILVVWDSVGASLNSTEDVDDEEDYSKQPGVAAKETNYAIKKFVKLANRYSNKETGKDTIAILAINQTYATIGMGMSVQKEKGGDGIYYHSSVIIQLSRKKDLTKVKGGDKYKYGIVSRAKVKKNHLFDGDECISELDIVVSADGIGLVKETKNSADIKGWDDPDEDGGDND